MDRMTKRFEDIHHFFGNGPLKVSNVTSSLPTSLTYSHVKRSAHANDTVSLPCMSEITHVDTESYPSDSVKEHMPKYKRYRAKVKNHQTGEEQEKEVFIKFSSVLDPNELVRKRYEDETTTFKQDKVNCPHNNAYVESLASYLTSNLTEKGVCPHFPRVYGVYNGEASKHFVEFTEEYYDHRQTRSFREGVKEGKWTIVPGAFDGDSDSDSESDMDSMDENSIEAVSQDMLNKFLSNGTSPDGLQDILKTIMKQTNSEIDTGDLHGHFDNMIQLMDKTDILKNEDNRHSSSDTMDKQTTNPNENHLCDTNENIVGDTTSEVSENTPPSQIYTDTSTIDRALNADDRSINESERDNVESEDDTDSELSCHTDDESKCVDIEQCTELLLTDIPVMETEASPCSKEDSNTMQSSSATITNIVKTSNMLDDNSFLDYLPTHDEPLKVRSEFEDIMGSQRYLEMRNVPVQVVVMEACDQMLECVFKADFQKLQHYDMLYTREQFTPKIVNTDATDSEHTSTINIRHYAYKWLLFAKVKAFERKWVAVLCQVCMALVAMQYQYDMVHNDMHGQNILLEETKDDYIHYRVNNDFYKVPTYGYIVKLIDLGRSTFQLENTMFMGDVFADRGEAGEQYSYIHKHKNASTDPTSRKHLLLPNPCFDLTRLACALLDEFFYSAGVHHAANYNEDDDGAFDSATAGSEIHNEYKEYMFRVPTTSMLFNMLCEWITDCEGEPVNRFENFELYKQIARRMRGSVPLHQLKRMHFRQYKVERDESVEYFHLTKAKCYSDGVCVDVNRPLYDSDNEFENNGSDSESSLDGIDSLEGLEDLNINDITSMIQKMCQLEHA